MLIEVMKDGTLLLILMLYAFSLLYVDVQVPVNWELTIQKSPSLVYVTHMALDNQILYGLWEGWCNNLSEIRWLCEKYSKVKVIYDVGIRSAVCREIVSNYFKYN